MSEKDLPQLATGASPRAVRTYQIGGALHAMATHFDHGDGWYYSRDIGDLEHIRYRSDYTGYNHWWRRFKRAFDWKHLTGRDRISKAFDWKYLTGRDRISKAFRLRPDPHPFLSALAWIQVSLPKDKNLPDGKVGPVHTRWEEDGEYIEMVGPTIGERIALFLMSEPEHWHAQTIAAEIDRIAFRKDRS